MLRPRPTSLDPEVTRVLLGALTGTVTWDNHAIHCLEEAWAFAAGIMLPDGTAIPMMTQAQIDTALTTLSNDPEMQRLMAAGTLNWLSLIKLIFDLFKKLLGGSRGTFPQFPP